MTGNATKLQRFVGSGILVLVAGFAEAMTPIVGFWEGTVTRDDGASPITLRLEQRAGEWIGAVGLPRSGVRNAPVDHVSRDEDKLLVRWQSPAGPCSLTLQRFGRDGLTGSLDLDGREAGAVLTRTPLEVPYTERSVSLTNGDVTLAGAAFIPKDPGPHPALVFTHGSGDSERWRFSWHVDWFCRRNIACLVLDKRGCGESTGDWRDADFEDYAEDALLGVHYMQRLPEIDPERVGLTGISQAGWVMPIAASKSDDVAFLIIESGPAIGVEEEGYYDYLERLRDKDYEDDTLREAEALLRLDRAVLRGEAGQAERIAAIRAVRGEPWYKDMEFTPSAPGTSWYTAVIDYDPRETLEAIACPVLWLFGEEDNSIPTARCVDVLNDIQSLHEKDWTIAVFPGGDHGLRVPAIPGQDALPFRIYPDEYFATQESWLLEHGLVTPGG